jgi:hypothetical protein
MLTGAVLCGPGCLANLTGAHIMLTSKRHILTGAGQDNQLG